MKWEHSRVLLPQWQSAWRSSWVLASAQFSVTHCVIHWEQLARKHMVPILHEVLNLVVSIVNFVSSRALPYRLFQNFGEEMEAHHQKLDSPFMGL